MNNLLLKNRLKETILRGIRTALLERGSATKAELSNTLEISFPTISKFIEKMKQDGEVTLVGLDGFKWWKKSETI